MCVSPGDFAAPGSVSSRHDHHRALDHSRRHRPDRHGLRCLAEKQGLAEPFKGLTTDGRVATGRFGIKSTGVSTEPVRKAADAFLAALTPEQRGKTAFGVDDDEWRKWMNQHFYVRQGVSFHELSAAPGSRVR